MLILLGCMGGAVSPSGRGQSPQPSSGGNQLLELMAAAMGFNMNATMKDCVILLTASAQVSPPRILLNWVAVPKNGGYAVTRRDKGGTAWTALAASLPADAVSYSDNTAQAGKIYEYKVATTIPAHSLSELSALVPGFAGKVKAGKAAGYEMPEAEFGRLYGYTLSGIEVPPRDFRGTVILLADARQAAALGDRIARLRSDLVGDGWSVIEHDVPAAQTAPSIRELVRTDYQRDPVNVRSVFILGHLPVPYSGDYTPDGHMERIGAQPADVFYASIDGVWTDTTVDTDLDDIKRGGKKALPSNVNRPGDGRYDQSEIPGKTWLEIGRVDFADMPAFAPLTETDLLARYLDKDHAFRHKLYTVKAGCLADDALSEAAMFGYSYSMAAVHTCTPMFGAQGVALVTGDWLKQLCDTGSQWAFAFGPSARERCGNIVSTQQLAHSDPKAVFTGLWGSYFGDWPLENDVMRAMIATKTYTLTCTYAGSPPTNMHEMSLGETSGYGIWCSQHPEECPGPCAGRVHISLLGDPTLRMHIVAPPSGLTASLADGQPVLDWKPSGEEVLGYHVYRAAHPDGPYVRVTQSPVTATHYVAPAGSGGSCYMVRAVALQTSASGSYYNLSQGIFCEGPAR